MWGNGGSPPSSKFPDTQKKVVPKNLDDPEVGDKHDFDEFACGPGKSAADTVWRQALASEASVASGGCAGAVLLDMQKFYERFNRDKLWARAKQFGMNLLVIRFALVAYSVSRLVCLGGLFFAGLLCCSGHHRWLLTN